MNPILRNVLAVLAGIVVSALVNTGIVNLGPHLVPLPEGADVSSMESLRDSIHLFSFANFMPPFLAHALGTLAGAFVAAKVAATHKMKFAITIGVLFMISGIIAISMIGGPLWFSILDLVVAYIPMAYLGAVLAGANRNATT